MQEEIARDIYENLYVGVRFAQGEAKVDVEGQHRDITWALCLRSFLGSVPCKSITYLPALIDTGGTDGEQEDMIGQMEEVIRQYKERGR